MIFQLGLKQCQKVPQLFYKHVNGELVLLVSKIVDDIKAVGMEIMQVPLLKVLKSPLSLGILCTAREECGFSAIISVKMRTRLLLRMPMTNWKH